MVLSLFRFLLYLDAFLIVNFVFKAWSEQRWVGASKKPLELINHLKKNHRRTKLPNTVTIDSIYAKNFLSLNSVLEAVIIDAFVLPGNLELKHFFFFLNTV